MRSVSIIASILYCLVAFAQSPKDSLWLNFNNPNLPAEERLVSIHRLARSLMYSNPDSSISLALVEFQYAEAQRDSPFMANALNLQGGSLTLKGDFAGALDKFYRMLEIREALLDTSGIAGAYNNIGNIYFHKGDYNKALSYYIRSLHHEQMLPGEAGIATSYINIGSIYALQEEYDRASDYFKRALSLYEKHDETNGMASCYANLGNIYKSLDSMAIARDYYLKGVPLMETTNDYYNLGILYANLATLYYQAEQFDTMFQYFEKSEALRNALDDRLGLSRLQADRGQAYVHLGRYRQAVHDCERSYDLASKYNAFADMHEACECLYKAHKGLNQNEIALTYHETLARLDDSIALDKANIQLQSMEFVAKVKEDSLAREEEKLNLEERHAQELHQKSTQRNILLGAGSTLLILLVVLYQVYLRTRKKKDEIEAAKHRTDELLLGNLPPDVASELITTGKTSAREFDNVTVLFTDFVGFTLSSQEKAPAEILAELEEVYAAFDEIIGRHGVRKIKSIGDGYMAAGGLPVASAETVRQTVLAALELQAFVQAYNEKQTALGKAPVGMRVGLHTGPVIAGIIGFQNFQYDLWGDTVNLANRMEAHGIPGEVNISRAIFELLQDAPDLIFTSRGPIDVKGREGVEMWLVGKK